MTGFTSLPMAEDGHGDHPQQFRGVARVLGPRWAHLPTVTIGLLGVSIFWSAETSYASPYLMSLGLSKSAMAVVFLAGPLSGLIMQPLVGVLADNCTSRFGRRRPYMLLGTIICVFSMLLLGFTRSVASIFTGWDNDSNDTLTIGLAVLAIYLIDFAINAVQAVDRALLVDTIPSSDQAAGNAWAARMSGIGGVVGFFVGNVDLPKILPFFGKSQLQVLSVVASLLLLGGHVLMASLVKERVLMKIVSVDGKSTRKSFVQEAKDIYTNIRSLPRTIRQIFIIQFFSSMAWFPVLFYSTIYVGDLYKRTAPAANSVDEQIALDNEAARLGSRALFFSALLSLSINLTLPLFVSSVHGTRNGRPAAQKTAQSWFEWACCIPRSMQVHLATLWAVGFLVFAGCLFATFFTQTVWGSTFIITITGFSWAIAQWVPHSLLGEAILTEPATHMTNDAGGIRLADTRTQPRVGGDNERDGFLPAGDESDEDEDEEEEARREERRRILSNSGGQLSRIDLRTVLEASDDESEYELVNGNGSVGRRGSRERKKPGTLSGKAGIILGIHNIFIVIPQFLVTGISAILFALLDPKKPSLPSHRAPVFPAPGPANGTVLLASNLTDVLLSRGSEILTDVSLARQDAGGSDVAGPYLNSVVYVFQIGGIAASFAFVLSWRLARELRHR